LTENCVNSFHPAAEEKAPDARYASGPGEEAGLLPWLRSNTTFEGHPKAEASRPRRLYRKFQNFFPLNEFSTGGSHEQASGMTQQNA